MQPIMTSWLARCCEPLAKHSLGASVLFVGSPDEPLAVWPDPDEEVSSESVAVAAAAFASRREVLRPREKAEDGSVPAGQSAAIPIPLGGRRLAVVTLALGNQEAGEWQSVAAEVASSGRWLPLLLAQAGGSESGPTELLVRLVSILLEPKDAASANVALVSELATRFACERVSLGFLESDSITLEAISHSARFDVRSRLGRAMGEAMEEAIDAESSLHWPGNSEVAVLRAHQTLCEQHETGCAISVPLTSDGQAIGAITVEYRRRHPAPEIVAARLSQIATVLGPLLALRRRDSKSLSAKIYAESRESIREWSGEEKRAQRFVGVAIAMVILLLAVVPGTRRITAPARLEGLIQRAIVAPIDGYVAESRARAGDLVEKGEILGRLDDTDLLLERRKWAARSAQLEKETRAAMASGDRAEARIARARLEQARAELDLASLQLERTQLIAPFSGVVAEGDLSRKLGSPIERGQVLFQVAPLDRYRIVLEVSETEIDDIAIGQHGWLKLTAQPGEALALEVERIVPIASSEDGRNFFRVEATLAEQQTSLRPGMEGVGKIEAGRRSLLWIYTHQTVDWIRLNLWAYLP